MEETQYNHEIKIPKKIRILTFKLTMLIVFLIYLLTILCESFILNIEHEKWIYDLLIYLTTGEL